jgi:hypothetical protein
MNIDFRVIDSLQFRFSQMEDTIARLKARVTALEAGSPLPPDREIVVAPVIHAPVHVPEPSVEQAPPPPQAPPQEIEYSVGMLMPTGGR